MKEITLTGREPASVIQSPIHRDYSSERVISQVPDAREILYRVVAGVVTGVGLFAPVLMYGDILIRLFVGAILVIVGGAYSLAIPRFFRDDVDEVIAGPDYLVLKRSGHAVTLLVAEVKRARLVRFILIGDDRVELLLRSRTPFGQRITLLPAPAWRTEWKALPDGARQLMKIYSGDPASLMDWFDGR